MSGYKIMHTCEDEPKYDKAKGQTFKNKDEVIDYLIMQLYYISGDIVEVVRR